MIIQIDSREKPRAISEIVKSFEAAGVTYFTSKLLVGDYQNPLNPSVIIDRKQNLTELCSNVTQDHERFRAELIRAQQAGIHLIILCEHGAPIETLEDVIFWENPRGKKRKKINGVWQTVETKAMKGEVLYKILSTISEKYNVDFLFCKKAETGRKIMEILA